LLCCFVVLSLALANAYELVPTPFGLRPKQCVHRAVGSNVNIKAVKGGVELHHPNGTVFFLPELAECVEYDAQIQMERMKQRELRQRHRNNTNGLPGDGWLDNAGYYPPSTVSSFDGFYTVPGSPGGGSQVLFYFIGTENFQSGVGVTILQPVLTWGNGINGWSIASWNCCPSGQQHESSPLTGFGPGASLYGAIAQAGGSWNVVSKYGGQQTVLTVAAAGRTFDWTDVTLETYSVTTCSQFASGPMTFSSMAMYVSGGSQVTPSWQPTGATECNGRLVVQSPSLITITHN